jgi:hypothetical protein
MAATAITRQNDDPPAQAPGKLSERHARYGGSDAGLEGNKTLPAHQTPIAAQAARWSLVLAAVLLAASASAQITISSAGLFRDNEGPNTIGAGGGDNLTVTVRNVSPNLGTCGYASHPAFPGVRVPLTNVFLSPNGFVSRSFAADVLPRAAAPSTRPGPSRCKAAALRHSGRPTH